MGLISRVSSRTYREVKQVKMFTSNAARALRMSVQRQNKLKFYGGDGQNVIAKALGLALHQNKNGNIKYRVYKTQVTGLRLDSDLWLFSCMAIGLASFYVNIFGNPKVWTPMHRFPGYQYLSLKEMGITPKLDDHSYGTWNYYQPVVNHFKPPNL